jgi:hypothetical protein
MFFAVALSIFRCPMSRRILFRCARSFAALLAISLCGCDSGPEAPELRDAPVYENAKEGFRFMVPDGWTQTASSILPAGDLEGDAFLARYRVKSPEAGSTLQIECFQENEPVDLQEYHSGPSYRVNRWKLKGEPETVTLGGREAQRMMFEATMDGREISKEVVCFRKGNRVYSFVGLFSSTDEKARQQIQRAVASVSWD